MCFLLSLRGGTTKQTRRVHLRATSLLRHAGSLRNPARNDMIENLCTNVNSNKHKMQ